MKFNTIKKNCDETMDVCDHTECGRNRKLYSGLGQCLCNEDNCYKMKDAKEPTVQADAECTCRYPYLWLPGCPKCNPSKLTRTT